MTVRLTHDAATTAFGSASGAITVDDGELTLDDSDTHVVTVEAPDAIADAFDTDKFYKTEDVTTARPIKQQYVRDGEVKTYVKPAEELKKSAWTFDNRPFTIDHPDSGIIHDVDDIRGFWRNPSYDEDEERKTEDLYIPVTDGAAQSFVTEYGDVSVGFFDEVVEDYDGDVGTLVDDTSDVDGYQTNIYGNHIAAVRKGRCGGEDGCGLDAAPHGSVFTDISTSDASTSFGTQKEMTTTVDVSTGDWVTWEDGAAHGKVDEVIQDGCTSRGKGDMEVCADGDDPAVVVEVYDDETGESKDELVRHMGSTLSSWSGPTADSVTTDAPDGLYQDDEGNWYGVAPAETADDEPKYDLNNCNDVKDAWNLRGSGDYSIDQSTLESRIKRAADAHDCPPENRPWVENDSTHTEPSTDGSTWEAENDNKFTIPMSDNAFDIPDLALDTLANKHDAVDAVIDERDEMAESLDEIRTELDEHGYEVAEDECPCDTVDDVLHTVDEKDEKIDNLEDTLSEYRADEREEKLTELVETYNADRENFEDADLDELKAEIDRRAEIAEDLGMSVKQSDTTTNDGATNDGGAEQVGTERTFGRGYGN